MTTREFIKKSIIGVAGFFLLPSTHTATLKSLEKKRSTKSDAYGANMAFGHSLLHSDFK